MGKVILSQTLSMFVATILPATGEAGPPSFVDKNGLYYSCPKFDLKAARNEYNSVFNQSVGNKQSNRVNSQSQAIGKVSGQISGQISGMSLIGTLKEAELARAILGTEPPSSWPRIAKNCNTVTCALTKVFGNEEAALRAMIIGAKFGYIATLDQSYNRGNRGCDQKSGDCIWSINELRVIHQVLSELPESFYRLGTLEKIVLVSRQTAQRMLVTAGMDWGGPFSGMMESESKTMLFSEQPSRSEYELFNLFTHEISHAFDHAAAISSGASSTKTLSETPVFYDIAWTLEENGHFKLRDESGLDFMIILEGLNPREDFAESVRAYVVRHDTLLKNSPERYQFVKDIVFAGKQFPTWQSRLDCQDKRDYPPKARRP